MSRIHSVATLAALLVLATTALPAAADPVFEPNLEILFEPEVPTWRDDVTVTVRGELGCFVPGLDPVIGFDPAVGMLIRLDLELDCRLDPPFALPFEVAASLGRLDPGEYTVHLPRPDEPEELLVESELTVHEVADLAIALPAEVPTDAAPFTIVVSGFTPSCGGAPAAQVDGQAISLIFHDGCSVLPVGQASIQTFHYPTGPLSAGVYEIRVFRTGLDPTADAVPEVAKGSVQVYDDELCVPSATALCLNDDVFRVSVEWRDFFGGSGAGQAIRLRDDTGMFWFFDPGNVELTVKVLGGCPVNGHHWVFVAAGSTVEYRVTVTDTRTDESRTYDNELGEVPSLVADTTAFVCG